MSKSDGLKIGIRFTEDLVGDITGNESAFTITGKEYQYVNGSLIDGDYLIDRVERYPITKVWQDDFNDGSATNTQVTDSGLSLKEVE